MYLDQTDFMFFLPIATTALLVKDESTKKRETEISKQAKPKTENHFKTKINH